MPTQTLTFKLPLNPKPNANNASSTLQDINNWTLVVKKTGTDRFISVSNKSVRVTLNSAHYTAFCNVFQGNSGNKTFTVKHTNSTVESVKWDSTTITLPDGASARVAVADADGGDGGDDADDSSRVA